MANSYLTRTNSSTGSTTVATISMWVKLSSVTTDQALWEMYADNSNYFRLRYRSDSSLALQADISNSTILNKITTRKFRDTNGFYHIVVQINLADSTAEDKIKLYINGERETSFSTNTNTSATSGNWVGGGNSFNVTIGRHPSDAAYLQGYLSHYCFVDGTVVAPTSFGQTDSTSGIWKFKPPTGVTFGTNGFHLKFENSGALGTDSAGSNNLTVNGNLKQAIDTPSNVFNTWNNNVGSNLKPGFTYSNGNTTLAFATPASDSWGFSNLGTFSGKYYAEFKMAAFSDNTHYIGVKFFPGIETSSNFKNTIFLRFAKSSNNVAIYSGFTSAFLQENMTSLSAGDIIGIAVDIENGTVQFYKNGSTFGNQVTGQATNFSGKQLQFACFGEGHGSSGGRTFTIHANFGNGFFGTTAISSEGTNASGIGKFEYDVPANHTAFCTEGFNL